MSVSNPSGQNAHNRGAGSVGWGLIGASRIARTKMVPAVLNQPPIAESGGVVGSWCVGVYSRNPARAREFAHNANLPRAFETLDELLQNRAVDIVYISTVPQRLFPMAQAALHAGKHVLCEVPLALSLSDARKLAGQARQSGLMLGVNYAYRLDPAIQEVRRLVEDGAIGELMGARIRNASLLPIQQQSWRLSEDVGIVLDRTIHSVDLIRYLFRDEVAQVAALAATPILADQEPDTVMTTLRLRRTGVLVQIHDSYTTPHLDSSLEVYGAGGTLLLHHWADEHPSELSLIRSNRLQVLPVPQGTRFNRAVYLCNESVGRYLRGADSAYSQRLVASAADGVRNLETSLAIKSSIYTGETDRV